ncbi:MAG: Stp1/IreP family PP2C-type Ser/Thr phosphatase [Desulfovermiculus sp.]|nr:Stp1/IreP family PP2C-type Ser/Thr phosphatase [Desulfovermiculus sp.]
MQIWGDHLWAQSHTGHKRKTNQDRFLVRELEDGHSLLLAVADGMGGETGGDIAAQMVIDDLEAIPIGSGGFEHDLNKILAEANEEIRQRAKEEPNLEGMGTTATVVLVSQDTAYWSHVGDSRLYHFHNGSLTQITTDHTFVQDLIADGTLSQEEADRHPMRNVLDQCVGCGSLKADSGRLKIMAGDRLLLCSDGLIRHVPDDSIKTVLAEGNARRAVEKLMDQALHAGGKDNVTVVVIDIPPF